MYKGLELKTDKGGLYVDFKKKKVYISQDEANDYVLLIENGVNTLGEYEENRVFPVIDNKDSGEYFDTEVFLSEELGKDTKEIKEKVLKSKEYKK